MGCSQSISEVLLGAAWCAAMMRHGNDLFPAENIPSPKTIIPCCPGMVCMLVQRGD